MSTKEDKVSKAVGKALDTLFAASDAAAEARTKSGDEGEDLVVSMDFHPTEGGVTITAPAGGDVASGADVRTAMDEFFAQQAVIDSQIFIPESMKCKHCCLFPCVSEREYDNMMAIGLDCEGEQKSNREIRFVLYRYMSMCYNGYLGKGNRKKLPLCVEGDIRDAYPKSAGTDYVGFKPKDEEDSEE